LGYEGHLGDIYSWVSPTSSQGNNGIAMEVIPKGIFHPRISIKCACKYDGFLRE
jgi:hypothetical protein